MYFVLKLTLNVGDVKIENNSAADLSSSRFLSPVAICNNNNNNNNNNFERLTYNNLLSLSKLKCLKQRSLIYYINQ